MTVPTNDSGPEWPLLLAGLRRARSETSLRRIARELDIAPSNIRKLLNGSVPHGSTRRKVAAWYATYLPRVEREPTREWLETVLGHLVAALPVGRRGGAMDQVRAALAELYRKEGFDVPRWLAP
ncbi:MAG TPA: hypothetical protein VFQ39_03045 [Longimicrobium sp.]|nr:hypothetical protein [Longimicrobium sp.]